MSRAPRMTALEAIRALERDGWTVARTSGSHAQLKHPNKPGTVTVSVHRGKILDPWLLSKIVKQAGLTLDEFRGLL